MPSIRTFLSQFCIFGVPLSTFAFLTKNVTAFFRIILWEYSFIVKELICVIVFSVSRFIVAVIRHRLEAGRPYFWLVIVQPLNYYFIWQSGCFLRKFFRTRFWSFRILSRGRCINVRVHGTCLAFQLVLRTSFLPCFGYAGFWKCFDCCPGFGGRRSFDSEICINPIILGTGATRLARLSQTTLIFDFKANTVRQVIDFNGLCWRAIIEFPGFFRGVSHAFILARATHPRSSHSQTPETKSEITLIWSHIFRKTTQTFDKSLWTSAPISDSRIFALRSQYNSHFSN
jgi:hypothetical protein